MTSLETIAKENISNGGENGNEHLTKSNYGDLIFSTFFSIKRDIRYCHCLKTQY